ncbi:MAG: ATP-binding cassette domain-containing protein [Veillonellaceae bacterium]|nr:ATP-binding cassette domain-containing protein [Veillonellaceae bacterium]
MVLEAQGISFGYKKGLDILKNFNLTVESHERVGIVAPSGFGKTTLCQILSGYLKPASGQVLLDGTDIHKMKGYCPVQMIWQHPEKAVNPRLRMKDIIAEGDVIEDRIIDGLGIERDWFNRFPRELSGGELQRFCIARALGKRTRFLIADEISTMLDLITQAQIWNFLLEELAERNIGLIVVTHSKPLMEHITTRQVILDTLFVKDNVI